MILTLLTTKLVIKFSHTYICTKYKIILVFGNSKHEQQNKKVVAYFSTLLVKN